MSCLPFSYAERFRLLAQPQDASPAPRFSVQAPHLWQRQCIVRDHQRDLDVGFGATPEEAVDAALRRLGFQPESEEPVVTSPCHVD